MPPTVLEFVTFIIDTHQHPHSDLKLSHVNMFVYNILEVRVNFFISALEVWFAVPSRPGPPKVGPRGSLLCSCHRRETSKT